MASAIEDTGQLPRKPTALGKFAERFLVWVDDGRLEDKTKKFYFRAGALLRRLA